MDLRSLALAVCAAGLIVFALLVGTKTLEPPQSAAPSSQSRLPESAARAKAERQQLDYLQQKIGECYSRGGAARLDPWAGYLACDLPVLRTNSR
jgi:hypothetical protein